MKEPLTRFSVPFLGFAGVLTLGAALLQALHAGAPWELQHRQFLIALTGAGLLAAVWLPSLRLPATAAAGLAKASAWLFSLAVPQAGANHVAAATDGVLAFALAGLFAVLLRDALLEARWERVLPLRQEG